MALTQRFRDVVLAGAVRIVDLTVDKVYPVLRALRFFYRDDTACAFQKKTFRQ
jgi:hypothetical protein